MPEQDIKKTADIVSEVNELVKSVIGKINSLDSKNDRVNLCSEVLNTVIAGAELSRVEKVGMLYILTNSRVKM